MQRHAAVTLPSRRRYVTDREFLIVALNHYKYLIKNVLQNAKKHLQKSFNYVKINNVVNSHPQFGGFVAPNKIHGSLCRFVLNFQGFSGRIKRR